MITLAFTWTCHCGHHGAAATEPDAHRDWTMHANAAGCAHISLAELEALIDVDEEVYPA